jgi:hypothetical protein
MACVQGCHWNECLNNQPVHKRLREKTRRGSSGAKPAKQEKALVMKTWSAVWIAAKAKEDGFSPGKVICCALIDASLSHTKCVEEQRHLPRLCT